MKRLVEIRAYKLKEGAAAAFDEAVRTRAIPLLREWGTDVVAHGPSSHEADTYYLIRAYTDLADLNARQDAFYGSPAWREGPREAVVSQLVSYLSTVLWLPPAAVDALRESALP